MEYTVSLSAPERPALLERPASIVLFGQDRRLVQTRQWVLERAGFRVHPVLSLADLRATAAETEVGLFLLCDSLAPEIRSRALVELNARWPTGRRLALMRSSLGEDAEPPSVVETFSVREGPGALVAEIRRLLSHGLAAGA